MLLDLQCLYINGTLSRHLDNYVFISARWLLLLLDMSYYE